MRPRPPTAVVVLAVAAGCAHTSRLNIELVQPAARTSSERRLPLASDSAWYQIQGDRLVLLFDIPLPGAATGAHYRLYLRLAEGLGPHSIGSPVSSGGFEAGFLIHVRGRGAGLTECVSGHVNIASATSKRRSGDLSLRFADGSTLSGDFAAVENAQRVREYERASPDVQSLLRGAGRLDPGNNPDPGEVH